MKSVFLVLALCLAATALPVQKHTKAVDWAAVEAQVGAIRTLVATNLQQVRDTANNDDETVGATIGGKLDSAVATALAIFDEADAEVAAMTLTADSAKAYLQRLEQLLLDTQAAVKDDVAMLSPAAQESIKATFEKAYADAKTEADKLYALLNAKALRTRAVDWAAVEAQVGAIRTLVATNLQQVRDTANNDDETVGATIGGKLDSAVATALAIFDEADAEVEAMTLTADSAKAYLQRLEQLLLDTQAAVKDDVAMLSPAAQESIKATFEKAYADAKTEADKLYALLNAKALRTRAVDWAAVEAQVGAIRTLVATNLQQVRDTANNDDETVGATIGGKLDSAVATALAIFDEADAEVEAMTLTADSAKAYLQRLEQLLLDTQAAVKDDVAMLSPAAQESIKATFEKAYADAKTEADKLYALLNAKALRTRAVDWAAVEAQVGAIRTLVATNLQQVRDTANNDDETVGATIGGKLDSAVATALAIFDEADAEVAAMTLTADSAKAYLQRLEQLLLDTQAAVKDDVAMLSPAAQESIKATFEKAYADAKTEADKLYALLNAKALRTRAVDWAAVEAQVGAIRTLVATNLQQVRDTANNDDETVGATIGGKLDSAVATALAIFDEADAEVEAMTLTADSAKAYLQRLEQLLLDTQAAVKDDVAMLSPAAQESIKATFEKAYADAKTEADKLYALLNA